MASWTISIPDAQVNRVVTNVCTYYGYQTLINGSPNPEGSAAFAKRMIREHVKNIIKIVEGDAAYNSVVINADAAKTSAINSIEADMGL